MTKAISISILTLLGIYLLIGWLVWLAVSAAFWLIPAQPDKNQINFGTGSPVAPSYQLQPAKGIDQ